MIQSQLFTDLLIEWDFEFDDPQETLQDKDLTVYIINKRMKLPVEFTLTDDNKGIVFLYAGKDQKRDGCYSLEMIINEGLIGQQVIPYHGAFELIMG